MRSPPLILIADDNTANVDIMKARLSANGYSVITAADGEEALASAQHNLPDLILLDIMMPKLDGIEVTRLLKGCAGIPFMPIILITARADVKDVVTGLEAGADDYLTKPVDHSALLARVRAMLRIKAMHDSVEAQRAQLSRYFSPSVVDLLTTETEHVNLDAQWRDITSMFTDIASFTTLVEGLPPETMAPLVNQYLTGMTEVVFDHGGTLVNIIGDALIVMFGAPTDQLDHAERAVACALALDAHAEGFRARWLERGVTIGVTRIGINSGPALVGSFGGGRFFDYTAYGDTISIAARLEAASKQLGTRICVSGSVVERVANFRGRPVGNLRLRGRSESLMAHEPLTRARYEDVLTAEYIAAYAKAEAADPAALPAFAALLGRNSVDGLVSFHLKRLLAGATGIAMTLE
jgi:adenylate cyclase